MNLADAPCLPHDPARVARDLRQVARNLGTIAASVGREAEEATAIVRAAADEARATAVLATEMRHVCEQVRDGLLRQAQLLVAAREAAADGDTVLSALTVAVDGIGAISSLIAGIAGNSRLLAINARIEAARAGAAGRGFDVVASAMTALSNETHDATREIERGTQTLHRDVGSTRALFGTIDDGSANQHRIAADITEAADRQTAVAIEVAERSQATVTGVEDAAATIGRVSSAATAVGLIARQLVRSADRLGVAA